MLAVLDTRPARAHTAALDRLFTANPSPAPAPLAPDDLAELVAAVEDRLETVDQAARARLLRGRAVLELELAKALDA